jgi:hypothetical protein
MRHPLAGAQRGRVGRSGSRAALPPPPLQGSGGGVYDCPVDHNVGRSEQFSPADAEPHLERIATQFDSL